MRIDQPAKVGGARMGTLSRLRIAFVSISGAALLITTPSARAQEMTATDVLGTVFILYASAELCSIEVSAEQLAELQRIGARMQVLSGFPHAGIDPMIEAMKKQINPAACDRFRDRFPFGIADAQANAAQVEARQPKPD